MTVAATATADYSVDQIVGLSMVTAGILNPAHFFQNNIPAAELQVGRMWLFLHLASLQNSGVVLRAREPVTATLTAGTAYVDAAADTISVEKHMTVGDGTTDRMVAVVNEETYRGMADKTQQGPTTMVYPEQQSGGTWRLYLWPVPDSTAVSITYSRTRRLKDVELGSVTLDLNPRWHKHIVSHLAQRFAGAKGRKDTEAIHAAEAGVERTLAENDETPRGDVCFIAPEWDY